MTQKLFRKPPVTLKTVPRAAYDMYMYILVDFFCIQWEVDTGENEQYGELHPEQQLWCCFKFGINSRISNSFPKSKRNLHIYFFSSTEQPENLKPLAHVQKVFCAFKKYIHLVPVPLFHVSLKSDCTLDKPICLPLIKPVCHEKCGRSLVLLLSVPEKTSHRGQEKGMIGYHLCAICLLKCYG
jgi:hypothetical protein